MMKKMLCAVCVTGFMMSSAFGAITYIDAEPGNTTIDGQAPVDGVNCTIVSPRSDTDNLWAFRTDRSDVNGEGIWVTDGGAAAGEVDRETTAPLKVDLTLPQAGVVYDLYAVIMNNGSGGGRWDVAARIGDSGDFTTYNRDSAAMTQALASDFEGTVTVSGGGDMTMKVLIGQYTTASAGESISIYINGLDSWDGQAGLDQRTRFDGIGYQAVPEPTTIALLSAGFLLQWRRRK